MVQMISPNKILHDIVSHKAGEVKGILVEDTHIARGVMDTEDINKVWDPVPLKIDVSVSPKLLKSSMRG